MTSISLTVVGSALTPFYLATLSITGVRIIIQWYLTKTHIVEKVEECKFRISGIWKGVPYDENILSDLKVLHDIVTHLCPQLGDKVIDKYD